MKVIERNKAIELRKQGKTYREILREIPVSKGSLSLWLRDISLTPAQLARVQYKNEAIKNNFIKFNELKKLQSQRCKNLIAADATQEIDGISKRELKFIGIALYWAEGHKAHAHSVDFVNSDPYMIKLMMRWFREICSVQEKRFRIRIYIHNPADIEQAVNYWSGITGVPICQFTKAYEKISSTSKRKSGNLVPYGICSIRISDIKLITRIQAWIKALMALSSSPV